MRRSLALVFALAACGGKLDPDLDSGTPGTDSGTTPKDAASGKDVITPPPSCSPIVQQTSVASNGSCQTSASWTCNTTQYSIQCSCPSAECTCSQQTGNMGSGVTVKASSVCPACSSTSQELATLCGFPTN